MKDADEMKCTILQALFLSYSVSESSVLANATCCVIGCNAVFPESHQNGWSYTLNYGQTNSKQIKIEGLCHKHFDRMNQKRKKCKGLQKKIWTKAELADDTSRRCDTTTNDKTVIATILVRFPATALNTGKDIEYERPVGTLSWTRISNDPQHLLFPKHTRICTEKSVPLRTAKIHTQFREQLLRRMHDVQKFLCNMVFISLLYMQSTFSNFPS